MQMIGIGPSLNDAPKDLAGWRLSPELIAGLRSADGFDVGNFGRLKFVFVRAMIEPSTDFSDVDEVQPRECPYGDLDLSEPVFWDDNGFFTMDGSDDPIRPDRVGSYSYAFHCSQMLKVAIGAPHVDPVFPAHAADADLEPFLTPPPRSPAECLAWLRARLPAGPEPGSLRDWLAVPGAPEWNEVFRYAALSLDASRVPGVSFVRGELDGDCAMLGSTGLPSASELRQLPGFTFGGRAWFSDGLHYRHFGPMRVTPADFLRALSATAALTSAFSRRNLSLSGDQAARLTDAWTVDRLPFEVFGEGLPF